MLFLHFLYFQCLSSHNGFSLSCLLWSVFYNFWRFKRFRIYQFSISKTTDEWHTNDMWVHTRDIWMTYKYIRVAYEWHTDDTRVDTSDIRVHTDDMRVHTSDIQVTYGQKEKKLTFLEPLDNPLSKKELLACNSCSGLFTKIKKGSGTSFWRTFSV